MTTTPLDSPTTIAKIRTCNLSAGDMVSSALLALHREIRESNPDLFADVSALLHDALNQMTAIEINAHTLTEETG